jgi:hypothetical protein
MYENYTDRAGSHLTRLGLPLAALTLLGSLTACGGGSSAGQATPPRTSSSPSASASTSASASASASPSPDGEQAVKALFDSTEKALKTKDAAAYLSVLSTESLARMRHVREVAAGTSKADLTGLLLPEQVTALAIRLGSTPAALARGDLNAALTVLMKKGFYDTEGPETMKKLTVTGDTASAPLLVGGKDEGENAYFVRENGTWKVDMVKSDKDFDATMKKSGRQQNMTGTDMLVASLSEGFPAKKIAAALALYH